MICSIEDCSNNSVARGWCDKHYTRWKRHKNPLTTKIEMHGLEKTPEYWVYRKMLARCYNKKQHGYNRYGGRGIKVCDRWLSSVTYFIEDMGKRPSSKHELDRIDNNGNYEPSNCRWATKIQQMNNTSYNKHLTYNGERLTLAEWARKLNVSYTVLQSRIKRGWSTKRALTTTIDKPFTGTW